MDGEGCRVTLWRKRGPWYCQGMDSFPPTHDLVDMAEFGEADEFASRLSRKEAGAYFTPDAVAATLVRWAVRDRNDRLLDPSCGDGSFVAAHARSVGVERDAASAGLARERAPAGEVHVGDFFAWAERTGERFHCAAGNPPFIRYQRFSGETRERALRICRDLGAAFSGLTSSWAPFLVATAGLLRPGGRMAFVVPAEIGHAPYAAPLLDFAVARFDTVHLVAIREKLFPDLSEDCWLLFADGYGGRTREIRLTVLDRFAPSDEPPRLFERIEVDGWRDAWRRRLRPFLMPRAAREVYRRVADAGEALRLGEVASVGIGYVSGANDFFHLRPSEARRLGIPKALLHPSVRNGRALTGPVLSRADVDRWLAADDPVLLLRLPKEGSLPPSVVAYLDGEAGRLARTAYKCRVRSPWHAVPDVQVPDYLLSYMSGQRPSLVRNDARCTATNSVHCVRLRSPELRPRLEAWGSPFVELSCEIEGHPLGGGLLKLEPREATQVVLPAPGQVRAEEDVLREATAVMRRWRHRAD
ncbi:N-6 DNA methylase [Methylorubrum extorquens]|uniref:site-specific DNA-methyltransferase (adenine-specific) n=1 Tax=Methylorubrum extorquens (strain CM4 / NCIMB 13688) TaxID=440085 RepID=B7L2X7_METC4|nr:N-6 DNA methylase [Methylorubrum extorquens]ACK86185.1 type I restriction-modification system methyltransferase subunit-like protein [Methylorubrum extorquens CM4]